MTLHHKPESNRRAIAAVEFGIVAPVFVILIVGAISICKMLTASSIMMQACREGGRLAAMDWTGAMPAGNSPNEKITRDVRNFLDAAGIDADTVTVTITHADGDSVGETFTLGDPDNYLKLFKIEVYKPHAANDPFSSYLTEGRGMRAWIVMRAGRSTMNQQNQ